MKSIIYCHYIELIILIANSECLKQILQYNESSYHFMLFLFNHFCIMAIDIVNLLQKFMFSGNLPDF